MTDANVLAGASRNSSRIRCERAPATRLRYHSPRTPRERTPTCLPKSPPRSPARRGRYEAELAALASADKAPRPPGWRLSPRAVETYVMGRSAGGGMPITPKYVGDRSLVQVAIATLASDRALMLVGEPGTAKSWLSEHLAAAISGTSALVVQGTAGTSEEHIKYGWNYALLLAEGPSPEGARALADLPRDARGHVRPLRGDHPHRARDPGRADLDPLREADRRARARRDGERRSAGFNIIATANTRDRGVNEMSAALKRRFNFVTVPVVEDLEQEIRIVTKREAELRTDYQVGRRGRRPSSRGCSSRSSRSCAPA